MYRNLQYKKKFLGGRVEIYKKGTKSKTVQIIYDLLSLPLFKLLFEYLIFFKGLFINTTGQFFSHLLSKAIKINQLRVQLQQT